MIDVIYRAEFTQPKGDLNPSNLKWRARFYIEVCTDLTGNRWIARDVASRVTLPIANQPDAGTMKQKVIESFELLWTPEQTTPASAAEWIAWGKPTGEHKLRVLDLEYEIEFFNGATYHKEPNDYTHYVSADTLIPTGADPARAFMAACGANVQLRKFTSPKVEPTWKLCQASHEDDRL